MHDYIFQCGDKLPCVDLYEGDPNNKVNTSELQGKVVIFGVPGAFTPTCNNVSGKNAKKNLDLQISECMVYIITILLLILLTLAVCFLCTFHNFK